MSANHEIGKPRLSVKRLNALDIYFYPKVHSGDVLPGEVRTTPQILDFEGRIGRTTRRKMEEEYELFRNSKHISKAACTGTWDLRPPEDHTDSVYIPESEYSKPRESQEMKDKLEKCEDIRKKTRELRDSNAEESEWMRLLRAEVFKPFSEVYSDPNNQKKLYWRWALHQDLHWNDFRKWKNANPLYPTLTGPKPDLTYAFPIIDATTAPASHSMYSSCPQIQAFSLQTLRELRCNGKVELSSTPSTPMYRSDKPRFSQLGAEHLICFPWAVVEAKRSKPEEADGDETFCYCQAANASASALFLREQLAYKAGDTSPVHEALVIFAFTCVGQNVKVWVTFRNSQNGHVEMRCIWASSITLIWGILVLQMIVENVCKWAFERAKPHIVRWVNQIRRNPSQSIIHAPDGDVVPQRGRAASCQPTSTRDALLPSTPIRGAALLPTPRAPLPRPNTPDRIRRPTARLTSGKNKSAPGKLDQHLRVPAPTPTRKSRNACDDDKDFIDYTGGEMYDSAHGEADFVPSSESDSDSDSDSDSNSDSNTAATSPFRDIQSRRARSKNPPARDYSLATNSSKKPMKAVVLVQDYTFWGSSHSRSRSHSHSESDNDNDDDRYAVDEQIHEPRTVRSRKSLAPNDALTKKNRDKDRRRSTGS